MGKKFCRAATHDCGDTQTIYLPYEDVIDNDEDW